MGSSGSKRAARHSRGFVSVCSKPRMAGRKSVGRPGAAVLPTRQPCRLAARVDGQDEFLAARDLRRYTPKRGFCSCLIHPPLFLNLRETPPEVLTRFASAIGWALR